MSEIDRDKLREELAEVFGWRQMTVKEYYTSVLSKGDRNLGSDAKKFLAGLKEGSELCWVKPDMSTWDWFAPDLLDIRVLLPAVLEKYPGKPYVDACLQWSSLSDGKTLYHFNPFVLGTCHREDMDEDPALAVAKAVMAAEGRKIPVKETADA